MGEPSQAMPIVPVLSTAQKAFIIEGLENDVRCDGRSLNQIRPIRIETGYFDTTEGSAIVKIGKTIVAVGVTADIIKPEPTEPDEGLLEFSASLSCTREPKLSDKAEENLCDEIVNLLQLTFGNGLYLDRKQLSIVRGEYCWKLTIDAHVIDWDGNPCSAATVATRAALFNTRLPSVTSSFEDGCEWRLQIADEPKYENVRLNSQPSPIAATVVKIGSCQVVDGLQDEFECSQCHVHVSANSNGDTAAVVTCGHQSLTVKSLKAMIETGYNAALQMSKSCEQALNKEEKLERKVLSGLLGKEKWLTGSTITLHDNT